MSTIFIVSGTSLETFYEETMDYLDDKFFAYEPASGDYTLTEENQMLMGLAEAYASQNQSKKNSPRHFIPNGKRVS